MEIYIVFVNHVIAISLLLSDIIQDAKMVATGNASIASMGFFIHSRLYFVLPSWHTPIYFIFSKVDSRLAETRLRSVLALHMSLSAFGPFLLDVATRNTTPSRWTTQR